MGSKALEVEVDVPSLSMEDIYPLTHIQMTV